MLGKPEMGSPMPAEVAKQAAKTMTRGRASGMAWPIFSMSGKKIIEPTVWEMKEVAMVMTKQKIRMTVYRE